MCQFLTPATALRDVSYRRWCPEEEAGWLSRLFFAFANSLVSKGAKKHLEQQDLWDTAFQVGLSTLISAPHA
jgi:hypothetical protein